jgi:hypothetical protein
MFNFIFLVGASSDNVAQLSTIPTMADIGRTFTADPTTVTKFNQVLTSPGTVDITSTLGAGLFREFVAQEFFTGPFMGEFPSMPIPETLQIVMKAFVPQLGPNFAGYRITGVEQTIEGMSARQILPSVFIYWGAKTIRIFGERVPEPASWLVAATSLLILSGRRKPKLFPAYASGVPRSTG